MASDFVQDAVEDFNNEVAFLRYFFRHARQGMGPSDGDIYNMIALDFIDGGGTVPESYREDLGLDEDWEGA